MKVDTQTLTIVLTLVGLVQVAALFSLVRINRVHRGQGLMALGNGLLAMGFFILYLNETADIGLVPIAAGNAAFVFGMILVCLGVLRFIGYSSSQRWLVAANIVLLIISLYFTFSADVYEARAITLSLSIALSASIAAFSLFFRRQDSIRVSANLLGAVFLFYALGFLARVLTILAGSGGPWTLDTPLAQLLFQLSIIVFGPLSTFGFIIMVNQRLNSENAEARERLEFVFNISPSAVAITRLEDGRVMDMNEAFSALTGYPRAEIIGKTALELRIWASDEDRQLFLKGLHAEGSCLNREFVFGKKDGSSFIGLISARVFMLDGRPHILSVTTDISERKRAEGEISRLALQLELERNYAQTSALTDGLTGLANRRRFDEVLRSDFFRLKRTKARLSMIMLDVDYFKKYNDTYGHIAGDDCLKHIAAILRKAVGRAHDTVARYGGEEFAVIMPETDIFGALALAERIRKAVESHAIPHSASKVSPFVTVSIGVATVDTAEIVSQDEIIQRADAALYEAKKAGRNRIEQSRSPVAFEGNGAEHHPRENLVKLVWSSYDESGNAMIDREHRQLFETSNMLVDAIVRGGDSEYYLPLLESLLEDIVSHFADEETFLKEIKFPYAEEHAALHAALVNKALDLAGKCRRREANVGELFSFVVYEIIARHLLMDDKKFFPYVTSR